MGLLLFTFLLCVAPGDIKRQETPLSDSRSVRVSRAAAHRGRRGGLGGLGQRSPRRTR